MQNWQVEIIAENLRKNKTVLKEIERNTELLDEIESSYSKQLDKTLSKIIRVMNEIKRVDDVAIMENLREQQEILEQAHDKLNREYWEKKRSCEKTIYSLRNSIKTY